MHLCISNPGREKVGCLPRDLWGKISAYLGSVLRKLKCDALTDTARTPSDDGDFARKAKAVLRGHCGFRMLSSFGGG